MIGRAQQASIPLSARRGLAAAMVCFASLGCQGNDKEKLKEELRKELREELLAELRKESALPGGSPEGVPAAFVAAEGPGEPEELEDRADEAPAEAEPTPEPPPIGHAPPPREEPAAEPVAPAAPEPAVDPAVFDMPATGPGARVPEPAAAAPEAEAPALDAPVRRPDSLAAAPFPADAPPESLEVVQFVLAEEVDREQRAPLREGTRFRVSQARLFGYAVIKNPGPDTQVGIEWVRGDEVKSRLFLKVGRSISGWRTWSTLKLDPEAAGRWTARLVDRAGRVLKTVPFTVR